MCVKARRDEQRAARTHPRGWTKRNLQQPYASNVRNQVEPNPRSVTPKLRTVKGHNVVNHTWPELSQVDQLGKNEV